MKKRKWSFSFLDTLLFLFAITLSGASGYLYFMDIPVLRYIFGWTDEGSLEKVGVLKESQGKVQRKSVTESGFRSITPSNILYNYDTVFTGPESGATILLDDGTQIDLGDKTLVKLVFDTKVSFGGLARATTVNVVAGNVKSKASGRNKLFIQSGEKKIEVNSNEKGLNVPQPIPNKPTKPPKTVEEVLEEPDSQIVKKVAPVVDPKIELLNPKPGESFQMDAVDGNIEKQVTLHWKIEPKGAKSSLKLRKFGSSGKVEMEREIESEDVDAIERFSKLTLKAPGKYEWTVTIQDPEGKNLLEKKSSFSLSPNVGKVTLLQEKIDGRPLVKNEKLRKNISKYVLSFHWKEVEDVEVYVVEFFDSRGKKRLSQRKTKKNFLNLTPADLPGTAFRYRVNAHFTKGFISVSSLRSVDLSWIAPKLSSPSNGERVSRDSLKSEGYKMVFTWQKNQSAEVYHFQISDTPDFRGKIKSYRSRQNFLVVSTPPKPGTYYWRVQVGANDTLSPFCAPFKFVYTQ